MTEKVFYQDSYQKTHRSVVSAVLEVGVALESTIFYPLGGGQPGDTGALMIGGAKDPAEKPPAPPAESSE